MSLSKICVLFPAIRKGKYNLESFKISTSYISSIYCEWSIILYTGFRIIFFLFFHCGANSVLYTQICTQLTESQTLKPNFSTLFYCYFIELLYLRYTENDIIITQLKKPQ